MSKILGTMVIGGLFLAAGAAQAAGTHPTSVQEVPSAWYAESIKIKIDASAGATQAVFPTAAREHGSSHDSYAGDAGARTSPSIARTAPRVFPSSINETGPVL